jgi:tetratricopeptide (TPR) repeat protein
MQTANSKVVCFAVRVPYGAWPGILFIVVATLLAYWPVFSAGFIWDDDAYVTANPMLTAADGWWRIWFSAHHQSQYFPLVYSTLRLEYGLWGLQPLGYHIVNVVLHIGNALMVWHLLRRLAVPGAWLAAAVFALHPVQVETVAWVTELKNTESTLFYLLAVLAWLNFCGGRSRWFYALALGWHALALFAKTTACTLPAVLLLVLWLRGERIDRRRVFQVIPFLVMGLAMGLLSVWWEKHLDNYLPKYHLPGGLDRLLVATHAVWFYAGKLLWPVDLTFSYPRWVIQAGDPWQYGWLAACLLVAALLWFGRDRLGWGPAAAVFFFVAVLSPMVGFIPLYTFYFSFVADHYQYLACLGLIAGFAALLAQLPGRWPGHDSELRGLGLVLLFALALLTHNQCRAYASLETLWQDTLAKNPRSWLAHTNLGRMQAARQDFGEAETNYLAALEINPAEEEIHYNYGNLLARTGRLPEAVAQYKQAIQLWPDKADFHSNLGVVLLQLHRPDDAMVEDRRAIALDPEVMSYHYNLANALLAEHQTSDAVAEFQRALQLEPDSALVKRRLHALGVDVN